MYVSIQCCQASSRRRPDGRVPLGCCRDRHAETHVTIRRWGRSPRNRFRPSIVGPRYVLPRIRPFAAEVPVLDSESTWSSLVLTLRAGRPTRRLCTLGSPVTATRWLLGFRPLAMPHGRPRRHRLAVMQFPGTSTWPARQPGLDRRRPRKICATSAESLPSTTPWKHRR